MNAAVSSPTAAPLALHGGAPVRNVPMPARRAVGPAEHAMIARVLAHYAERDADFGYQGFFEEEYCRAFTEFMGGGHADAVATGTCALFAALAAFELPRGSEVLTSPITDPGAVSAVILNGLVPRLVDSAPGSFNVDLEQIRRRLSPSVRAILLTHTAGSAVPETAAITDYARAHGVRVLEDCSQAHGARVGGAAGRLVGTLGDIAAFSTMYRKASITGASGGVVYSRDADLAHRALAHADRGKPRWLPGFDDRDPATFLFPALNLHTDELSCAIGTASLGRLPDTIARRLAFVRAVAGLIAERSAACRPYPWTDGDSPFIYPVLVDPNRITCSKQQFAEAVRAEGIGLSPHYRYVVRDWPWVARHVADDFDTPNARAVRDGAFHLYLNENYTPQEARDTVEAILKVERHFGR